MDELTGGVRVDRYLVACDCGQVLDRQARAAEEGSVAMGLGYALWEDFASRDGLPLARDFSTTSCPPPWTCRRWSAISWKPMKNTAPWA